MKRIAIAVLALALAACASHPLTIGPVTTPGGINIDLGIVQHLVADARADVTNAAQMAASVNDVRGMQCHATGLRVLDTFSAIGDIKLLGIASLAEEKRILRLSSAQHALLWQQLQDDCAPVYSWQGVFGPIARAAGAVLPIPIQ